MALFFMLKAEEPLKPNREIKDKRLHLLIENEE
jgi:hypothetical protein